MDFGWAVTALRRGLKVTRNHHNWNDNARVRYLYMVRNDAGNHVIRMRPSGGLDFEWHPSAADILDVTDWEEYVEHKKPVPGDTPILQFIRETTGSSGLPFGEAVEDQSDFAKEVRKAIKVGEDTGYMTEQLEMLADIYAEKISQRVAQLLQAKKEPDHV